jgi:hypothetical protein
MIKLNLSKCSGFSNHRSGWSYCISSLMPMHSNSGIFVDDFIERSFSWQLNSYYLEENIHNLPYKKNWIGFFHNPPNIPEWFDMYHSPMAIIEREVFAQSLKTCKCIIVLSDYLKEWLSPRINVPIISVKHPTETPKIKWSQQKFLSQKKTPVIQLGYWLRDFFAIHHLKCGPKFKKIWFPSNQEMANIAIKTQERCKKRFWEEKYLWSGVTIQEYLSNEKYDDIISRSVVLLKLYDSSANNAIIECIARNTPILVNKIPAVVEYLGDGYPLYFHDMDEASEKIKDTQLIIESHQYLKSMNKNWINGKYFAKDLVKKLKEI